MQLSAAQTSLEPQPHRVDPAGPRAVRARSGRMGGGVRAVADAQARNTRAVSFGRSVA